MKVTTIVLLALAVRPRRRRWRRSRRPTRIAAMAPLAQYLMPEADEIALARTAAPATVSADADVMVLRKDGYATAAKGTNGFMCLVERGWAGDSKLRRLLERPPARADLLQPRGRRDLRADLPDEDAARARGQVEEGDRAGDSAALDDKRLPAIAPGAMCFMMSRQQYLNDDDKAWRPHTMFFVPADAKTWGANVKGSPVMAADDPEEHVTIFMIPADHWSDGSAAPGMHH